MKKVHLTLPCGFQPWRVPYPEDFWSTDVGSYRQMSDHISVSVTCTRQYFCGSYAPMLYARRESVEPGEAPLAARNDVVLASADTNLEESALPVATASASKGVRTVTHKVKPGESLATIAQTYGVTPEEIKQWNSLRRNAVRTGQLLRVNTASAEGETETLTADAAPASGQQSWQPATPAATAKKSTKAAAKPKAPAATSHKLKSGETLSSLSKKYGVSIAEIKKANGMKSDNLRAGSTIKIPAKAKTPAKSKKSKKRRRR